MNRSPAAEKKLLSVGLGLRRGLVSKAGGRGRGQHPLLLPFPDGSVEDGGRRTVPGRGSAQPGSDSLHWSWSLKEFLATIFSAVRHSRWVGEAFNSEIELEDNRRTKTTPSFQLTFYTKLFNIHFYFINSNIYTDTLSLSLSCFLHQLSTQIFEFVTEIVLIILNWNYSYFLSKIIFQNLFF